MIVLDLQIVLFILLCCVLATLSIVWALLRRKRPQSAADLRDAWRLLDGLPFSVIIAEGHEVGFMNQAARQLLPDTHATLGALGILDGAPAARSGRLAQPVPLRWWSQPLDEQHTLLVLADEREPREQQAFVSRLSHELRTPLTALVAHSAIARDPQIPAETVQASLATIQRESERIARLVRDLLELYRIETADDPLLQPTNLALVAEEALAAVVLRAEERGLQLALEAERGLPRVLAHPDRLKQVFVNLLDNAVKYCRPGDHVVVHLRKEPQGVRCTVQDSGPGIAAADLPHVAERLYRGRTDVEGSGIGLALVSEILRQHGTALTIKSVAEGGQTGTVCEWTLQPAEPLQ